MSNIYLFHPEQTKNRCYALREPEQCYNNSVDNPLDPEYKYRMELERIRGLRLIDDDFMTVVFNDKASAELLIRIIMNRNDLTVVNVVSQRELKNLHGRSVRLDIYAVDSNGNAYNIEVQREDKGAGVRRARYNSSLMDAMITSAGDDYNDLAETYVIFITENDVFGRGLPIYHLERTILETGQQILDGSHIIYVNSQIRDETALGRLMHDFWCTSHEDMHYDVLADRVRHFKTEEEGVRTMCKAIEEMCNEVAEAAVRNKAIQVARMMKLDGESDDKINKYTGLTMEEIQVLDGRQLA